MAQVMKISDIPPLDPAARDVLKQIALHIADQGAAFVSYSHIAKELGWGKTCKDPREKVRRAVNRLIKKNVVKIENGKMSITKMLVLD